MAKPWVLININGESVGRCEGNESGPINVPTNLEAAISAGMITAQYRPRKAKTKRKFPYAGNGRL